jgi:hypothetical protein
MNIGKLANTLILGLLLPIASGRGGDEKSLSPLQQTLALKKYVDLTHEFAPGIPRWPGFPNEKRRTIYWYDQRPNTKGTGFFWKYSRMSANGHPRRSPRAFH